jgi:predicted Zn-dependent protease
MGNYSRYGLLAIILFIAVGMSFTYFKGKAEDRQSNEDFQKYQQALQFIQKQDGESARKILLELKKNYPENVNVNRYLGLSNALVGQLKPALLYYQKALELNPFLQLDPLYTLQYGEILYFNGEYAKSKILLEKTMQLSGSESYKERVNQLLTGINNRSN